MFCSDCFCVLWSTYHNIPSCYFWCILNFLVVLLDLASTVDWAVQWCKMLPHEHIEKTRKVFAVAFSLFLLKVHDNQIQRSDLWQSLDDCDMRPMLNLLELSARSYDSLNFYSNAGTTVTTRNMPLFIRVSTNKLNFSYKNNKEGAMKCTWST